MSVRTVISITPTRANNGGPFPKSPTLKVLPLFRLRLPCPITLPPFCYCTLEVLPLRWIEVFRIEVDKNRLIEASTGYP